MTIKQNLSFKFSFSITLYGTESAHTLASLSDVSNPHLSPFSSTARQPCKSCHYTRITKMWLLQLSAPGAVSSNELKYPRKICPELNKGLVFTEDQANIRPRSPTVPQTCEQHNTLLPRPLPPGIVDHTL